MNKIELLPKDIYYKDDLYQVGMWVTAFGRLCIGYRNLLDVIHKHLFSVCVEPENTPNSISFINDCIGNAVSVDDACEELLDWIDKNKEDFKCH